MTTISASMVKDLRDRTGAGMMDCKNALQETQGDMEAAIDWLRKKGLAKAAKKAGRVAADGLIGVSVGDRMGAMVEVNAETDFVARNDLFQKAVRAIAALTLNTGDDVEALKKAKLPGEGVTVEEHLTALIAKIGENMSLRRAKRLTVEQGVVVTYVHNAAAPELGRMGVLVAAKSTGDKAKLTEIARQIAMHVAAAAPIALSEKEVDPQVLAREKKIFEEQAKESGKPANVIEKMVEGRVRKFYEEVVLLKQAFVIDPTVTVEKFLEASAKAVGAPIALAAFERYALGDGIEKEEKDFASEVAAAMRG